MSFKNIKFIDPVESLSGKRNKNSKTCFFQGKLYGQRGWGTGERNLLERPYTAKEVARHNSFSAISKNVAARMDIMSSTYNADMAAFMAQRDLPGGIRRFRPWLWADEKKKLGA